MSKGRTDSLSSRCPRSSSPTLRTGLTRLKRPCRSTPSGPSGFGDEAGFGSGFRTLLFVRGNTDLRGAEVIASHLSFAGI